jgi:hypothetical protein
VDTTSKVPYAHGFGIISDQLYEVILIYTPSLLLHCNIFRSYICPTVMLNVVWNNSPGTIAICYFAYIDDIGALPRRRLPKSLKCTVCSSSG